MTYTVIVDDNYHYMDESERYKLGEFETRDAAVEACRKIVDRCLEEDYEPGMTAETLWMRYTMFGEDPWIAGDGGGERFSAWDYAKERAKEVCAAGAIPKRGAPPG
jgi:hypothetical protein